jgi:hypothetical protein
VTTYLRRSDWTKTGPVRALQPLDPATLRGFAVHWPGTSAPLGSPPPSSIAARLESYRKMHTAPGGLGTVDGASDIAYQTAIDQEGRVWPLRGATAKSGANGSGTTNALWGAVLLLLGPGEDPSRRLVQAVQDYRAEVWLRHFPRATRVVGHRDLHGTTCPGPEVYDLVKSGAFARLPPLPPRPPAPPAKTPAKEPSVAELTVKEIRDAVLGTHYKEYADENRDGVRNPRSVADFIVATHANSVQAEERLAALQDVLVARDDAQMAVLKEIRDALVQPAPSPSPVG